MTKKEMILDIDARLFAVIEKIAKIQNISVDEFISIALSSYIDKEEAEENKRNHHHDL